MVVGAMLYIGQIDRSVYACVASDISTEDVVITEKQVRHVFTGHPEMEHINVVERLAEALRDPDYILADNTPRTAVVFKLLIEQDERYRIILKLATKTDEQHPCNSVITAFYISEKKWNKYLRNKKVLYSRNKA